MLLLAIAGMPAAPSTADDHVEIGTKVYPKSRDIEFVDSLSKPINVDDIELPLEVSRIDGATLHVNDPNLKSAAIFGRSNKPAIGTIMQQDVVPANDAVHYFTEHINREPDNAYNYYCRSRAFENERQFGKAIDDAVKSFSKNVGIKQNERNYTNLLRLQEYHGIASSDADSRVLNSLANVKSRMQEAARLIEAAKRFSPKHGATVERLVALNKDLKTADIDDLEKFYDSLLSARDKGMRTADNANPDGGKSPREIEHAIVVRGAALAKLEPVLEAIIDGGSKSVQDDLHLIQRLLLDVFRRKDFRILGGMSELAMRFIKAERTALIETAMKSGVKVPEGANELLNREIRNAIATTVSSNDQNSDSSQILQVADDRTGEIWIESLDSLLGFPLAANPPALTESPTITKAPKTQSESPADDIKEERFRFDVLASVNGDHPRLSIDSIAILMRGRPFTLEDMRASHIIPWRMRNTFWTTIVMKDSESLRQTLRPKWKIAFHELAVARCEQGLKWKDEKNYAQGIIAYQDAIRLDSECAVAYDRLAWIGATCSDVRFRDGKQAVEYAMKACELSKWKDGRNIETLAAACAESGDFDQALEYQTQFIDANSDGDKADFRSQLRLYEAKRAYHEGRRVDPNQ